MLIWSSPPPPKTDTPGQQEFDSEAGSIRRMATTKIVQEKNNKRPGKKARLFSQPPPHRVDTREG